MRRRLLVMGVLAGLCGVGGVGQTVPAGAGVAPKGSTGQCNDGSYTSAAAKWQACGRHKGVKQWFGGGDGVAAKASAPAAGEVAPGGGPGMVWLNPETKVYHCAGGRFYGKTKGGRYVSEADAVKAGAHPDRGKLCAKP